jgi:cytochrome P450
MHSHAENGAAANTTPRASAARIQELEDDPYPWYAQLREEAPAVYVPCLDAWVLGRWDDVQEGLKRTDVLTSLPEDQATSLGGPNVLTVDGPEHTLMREPLRPSMRATTVDARLPKIAIELCDELLRAIQPRGHAEMMTEFFEPLSVLALARSLRLPADIDASTLARWFAGLSAGTSNYERDARKQALKDATSAEIDRALQPLLERLDEEPDDSLLASLLHARAGPLQQRIAWLMPTFKLVLIGGLQEPGHGGGSILHGLLSDVDQLAALRVDPDLIPAAVWEGLRWVAPIGATMRMATPGSRLGGTELPTGSRVILSIASANRDAAMWERADRFDLRRPRHITATFGFGAHACVGVHFARVLLRVAIARLIESLPNLRLSPNAEVIYRGWIYRAPKVLPVLWDPPVASHERKIALHR